MEVGTPIHKIFLKLANILGNIYGEIVDYIVVYSAAALNEISLLSLGTSGLSTNFNTIVLQESQYSFVGNLVNGSLRKSVIGRMT